VAFTYDLTTSIGKVRLRLTDTQEGSAWFTDAEINTALTDGGNVDGAIVILARILLMDKARRSMKYANTEGSYDDTGQVAALRALISMYGGDGAILPTVTITMPALLPMDAGYNPSNP